MPRWRESQSEQRANLEWFARHDENSELRYVGDGRVEERIIGLAIHGPRNVDALGASSFDAVIGL